jgi:hypothetical protein
MAGLSHFETADITLIGGGVYRRPSAVAVLTIGTQDATNFLRSDSPPLEI